ncbi:Crp/Fnr family transcriptional regulator [Rhodoferax sp. BAB1]|uniref:Crp/Fnr family transcriptional regulator n=1 Tax=Rhodoferax sp. BAB1 TaxID=2741720 RepID=UPI00157663AF|nr:Crp/Fnr family transcriptional regulator [Rhodoferax sp. BAB1]QKO20599.1 Crp/Fnr family transcriptional regulator [Rhodoferax sp. BAB1]
MIPIKTESAWRGTSDCRNCGIRDMVLFADLNEQDFGMIHAPIDDLEFAAGEALYSEGSRAQGIYTLRRGMIKLVRVTTDGRQRIVRVLRPGDVAGLEALGGGHFDCDAVALSGIAVCRIPLEVIHTLGASSPRLHLRLMQKWQAALRDADDWLADLNFGTARQRVSNFILKMRSPTDDRTVTLFARDDMGAMLDLKLETVSREVSRLVREAVIEPLDKQGRVYRLHEPQRLLQAA